MSWRTVLSWESDLPSLADALIKQMFEEYDRGCKEREVRTRRNDYYEYQDFVLDRPNQMIKDYQKNIADYDPRGFPEDWCDHLSSKEWKVLRAVIAEKLMPLLQQRWTQHLKTLDFIS